MSDKKREDRQKRMVSRTDAIWSRVDELEELAHADMQASNCSANQRKKAGRAFVKIKFSVLELEKALFFPHL